MAVKVTLSVEAAGNNRRIEISDVARPFGDNPRFYGQQVRTSAADLAAAFAETLERVFGTPPDPEPVLDVCPLCGSEDRSKRLMTGCGLPCDDASRWHESTPPAAEAAPLPGGGPETEAEMIARRAAAAALADREAAGS